MTISKDDINFFKTKINNQKKQNQILCSLLYEMICQADEDTPSEYRTKHFRSTMSEGFDYLQKINYIKLNKGE